MVGSSAADITVTASWVSETHPQTITVQYLQVWVLHQVCKLMFREFALEIWQRAGQTNSWLISHLISNWQVAEFSMPTGMLSCWIRPNIMSVAYFATFYWFGPNFHCFGFQLYILLGDSSVTSIALGGDTSCALLNGGAVWCWGYNSYGQVGTGSTTDMHSPTEVELDTGVQVFLHLSLARFLPPSRFFTTAAGSLWFCAIFLVHMPEIRSVYILDDCITPLGGTC
jgi:hypothetical protein